MTSPGARPGRVGASTRRAPLGSSGSGTTRVRPSPPWQTMHGVGMFLSPRLSRSTACWSDPLAPIAPLAVAGEVVELGEQRSARRLVRVAAELDRVDAEVPAPVPGREGLGVERPVGKPGDRVDLVVLDVDRDVAGDGVAHHRHVAPVAEVLGVAEARPHPLAVGELARRVLAVGAEEAVGDAPAPEVGAGVVRVDRRVVGVGEVVDVVDRAARLAGRRLRGSLVQEQSERVRVARVGEAERLLGAVPAAAGGERDARDQEQRAGGAPEGNRRTSRMNVVSRHRAASRACVRVVRCLGSAVKRTVHGWWSGREVLRRGIHGRGRRGKAARRRNGGSSSRSADAATTAAAKVVAEPCAGPLVPVDQKLKLVVSSRRLRS